MDKMEMGGIRGRGLGQKLESYFKEFHVEFENWINIKFNPLDLESERALFDAQFQRYQQFCDTFERKLASVFNKAIDECRNFEEAIKLIEMTGPLLFRGRIYVEIEPRFEHILELYERDIEFVSREFGKRVEGEKLKKKSRTYWESSIPPVSGALMWVKSLKAQLTETTKDLDILGFT